MNYMALPFIFIIDADDTLWHDSRYFRQLEQVFYAGAASFGMGKADAKAILLETVERSSGRGEHRFVAAVRTAAVALGISGKAMRGIDQQIERFQKHPIELMPGVKATLGQLDGIPKLLLTKGVLAEQQRKVRESGLSCYFDRVVVVKSKTRTVFGRLIREFKLVCWPLVVVGNSIKHDVCPAVHNGAFAIWFNHEENKYGRNAPLPAHVPVARNWSSIPVILDRIHHRRGSSAQVQMAVASGNPGKLNWIRDALEGMNIQVSQLRGRYPAEGRSAQTNAIRKAISGSRRSNLPTIATDEHLTLGILHSKAQPRSLVRRKVGTRATDAAVFDHYRDLIRTTNRHCVTATITTWLAVALRGHVVYRQREVQQIMLRLPGTRSRIQGRPLAGLHYIAEFSKYYSELSKVERRDVDNRLNNSFRKFVCEGLRRAAHKALLNGHWKQGV